MKKRESLPETEKIIAEANRDLAELQRYIGELMRFLPLAFCSVNPFNLILEVSRAFCDLSGHSELEAIGRNIEIFFLEKKKIKRFQEKIVSRKEKFEGEFTLVRKGKKNVPVSISALGRYDEEGEFVGYFLTVIDISKAKQFQKELETQVEEKTKELKEKVEELEKFSKFVVGRELEMIKLKEKVLALEKELEKKNQ